jgi:Ca-activated chloride channel family protein
MRRLNNPVFLAAISMFAAALCLPWAQHLLAQQAVPTNPAPKPQDEAVFTSDTNLVVLYASVLDKSGKLITNLPQSAFKVYENGVEQPIKIFRREDVPVSMGIIIDNSGSMRDKRAKVAAASLALVKASNPDDEVFIVNFNDEPYLDQPFTNNTKKLEEALDRLDSRGGTAMRDAISLSIDYAKEKAKREKKVLVVVTDGNDNTSVVTLEQLVQKSQRSEVLIYAVGLLSEEEPRDARQAKKALKLLTGNSGGLDYYPKDVAEIDKITPQIAHEIRSQYVLAYLPTNTAMDGTFRKINVVLNGYRGTVRTRNGYYANAPGSKTGGSK